MSIVAAPPVPAKPEGEVIFTIKLKSGITCTFLRGTDPEAGRKQRAVMAELAGGK